MTKKQVLANFRISFYLLALIFCAAKSSALERIKLNKVIGDNTPITCNNFLLKEQIQGKITDAITGAPIANTNIEIFGSLMGTSSNELGEFILEVETLPVTIVFSHLNYEKKVVEVTNASNLSIQLTPLVNSLNEVVLTTSKRDRYALDLAKNAFSKMRKLSDEKKYGRAFYRQKSKNGDEYTEFSEIIYDAIFTTEGIENWEIIEGRYALKREKVNNSNFTLLSRVLKSIQPDSDDLVFPLRFNIHKFYDVKVIDMLSSEDGDIAVLWFKPLDVVIAPILEAEVYINTKTLDVLKIEGTVKNDHLKFIRFQEKNAYTKNYQLSYEMTFKKGKEYDILIDYIKVNHAFDYYKNDAFLTHVTSTSNLTFFEHYELDKTRRIRNKFWKKGSDWEALNKIGYNDVFWRDNPIVKRTPVEDEVIAAFEKSNAFESIFLNTKEQIAFMQSNLRGDAFIEKFDTTIRGYNNNNPVEKVFLHTDRDLFAAGEHLWYKAYAALGEYHQYSLASRIVHVDLINSKNKIVLSKTHKLNEGQGNGHIELPSNLQAGDYQLRAYTNWMRNFDDDFFFSKKVKILNKRNANNEVTNIQKDIDLQFFPEGGHAVNGIPSKITFKAIGGDGLGKKIKGHIKNSKGETVTTINSIYKGMGFFTLKPELNETYAAILNDGSSHRLPEIQSEGYTMLIDNLDSRNIKVKIQASEKLRGTPFYIIGLSNNNKQYQGRFKFNTESVLDFEIPKSKLPNGVLTLTLFDEAMRPWSERALFINNKTELSIETKLNKSDFKKRDKFELKVHINDAYGAPLSTNFSVAVTDAGKIKKNKFGANILTHLLLQSDIKGYVEDPWFYFSDNKRSTAAKLDLVMLTHGWRKFNWQELVNSNFDAPKEFSFEKGYTISGIATDSQDEPLKNRELKMIAKSGDLLNLYVAKTKEDGSFKIEDVTENGKVELAFNAYKSNGDQINTKVILDTVQNNTNLPIPNFKNIKEFVESDSNDNDLISENTMPFFEYGDALMLDEVLVKGKKGYTGELKKYSESLYGVDPDYTVVNDGKKMGNILFNLNNIPGLNVDWHMNIAFFKGNRYGPLWILDGVRFPRNDATGGSGDAAVVASRAHNGIANAAGSGIVTEDASGIGDISNNIPEFFRTFSMSNIDRIEVLSGAKTAVYGPEGKYGVIIVYSKTGKPKPNNAFASSHKTQGFSASKEFYSPKYDVVLDEHKTPDNRTTLYWNPSVKTDVNGNATIIFYNSDDAKSFEVDVQALSKYGAPGAYLNTYKK